MNSSTPERLSSNSRLYANAVFETDDLFLVVWTDGSLAPTEDPDYVSMYIYDDRDPNYPVSCSGTTTPGSFNDHYVRHTGAMVDADVVLACSEGPDGATVNVTATWTNNGSAAPTVTNELVRDDLYGNYHLLYRDLVAEDVDVSVVITAGDVVVRPPATDLQEANLEMHSFQQVKMPSPSP